MSQTKTLHAGFTIFVLLFCAIILPAFQCNKGIDDNCNGPYTQKNIAAPVDPVTSRSTFAIGDTLRFVSVFGNTLQSVDGTETFSFSGVSYASMQVEILAVVPPSAGSTIPTLQPVSADFNPLIFDGQVETSYALLYRYRQAGNNNVLSFGLQSRVKGTYILRFKPSTNGLYDSNNYPCTSFMLTGKFGGNQNTSLFTTYNTTALLGQSNYSGVTPVNVTDKNFVVVTIN